MRCVHGLFSACVLIQDVQNHKLVKHMQGFTRVKSGMLSYGQRF
jgi:hypothetical protein